MRSAAQQVWRVQNRLCTALFFVCNTPAEVIKDQCGFYFDMFAVSFGAKQMEYLKFDRHARTHARTHKALRLIDLVKGASLVISFLLTWFLLAFSDINSQESESSNWLSGFEHN